MLINNKHYLEQTPHKFSKFLFTYFYLSFNKKATLKKSGRFTEHTQKKHFT